MPKGECTRCQGSLDKKGYCGFCGLVSPNHKPLDWSEANLEPRSIGAP